MVYEAEASSYVERCKSTLRSADIGPDVKKACLNNVLSVLKVGGPLPENLVGVDAAKFKIELLEKCFPQLVVWLCSTMVETNAVLLATSPDFRELLIKVILSCENSTLPVVLTLCMLEREVTDFAPTFYIGSKALLLQILFEKHNLMADLIVNFAQTPSLRSDVAFEDTVIQRLVSFPDKAMSMLGSEGRDSFLKGETFIASIIRQLAVAIERLTKSVRENPNTSLTVSFAGRLLGKIASRGYHEIFWTTIMSESLSCHCLLETDQIYIRLFSTVISNSPVGGGLDSLLCALLVRAPHFEHIKRILGSLIARRTDVQKLLTHQFPLCRTINTIEFCRNLVGYLASSHAWLGIFQNFVIKLAEVWSSRTGIRHQSYEQHLYLSRLVVCAASHIKNIKLDENESDFINQLRSITIEGVTNHIDSPSDKMKVLGMVVGEIFTAVLYPDSREKDGAKLKFSYAATEETNELKSLMNLHPYVPWKTPKLLSHIADEDDKEEISNEVSNVSTMSPVNVISDSLSTISPHTDSRHEETLQHSVASLNLSKADDKIAKTSNEALDSDDDELPPLEDQLGNQQNVTLEGLETPKTVRQCLEFLNAREQDYPTDYLDRFILNLRTLPFLIRSSNVDLSEISVELANRLLSMECPCRMADFNSVRIDAMVAITVSCPVHVAKFLTAQFYEPTYSISHRLDMLRVLTMAAEVLSVPSDMKLTPSKPAKKLSLLAEMTNLCHPLEQDDWRKVVDKRIRDKTIYFGKNRSINEPQRQGHNRFGLVAGEFFYSLLRRYDGTSPHLDLVNRDFMVLERLIYSLAIIFHCAADTPALPNMTQILLEFLLAVRNHEQPVIRRAVIFALGYVYLDVPPVLLTTQFDALISESADWLVQRCANDPDAEIERLSNSVLACLFDAMRVVSLKFQLGKCSLQISFSIDLTSAV